MSKWMSKNAYLSTQHLKDFQNSKKLIDLSSINKLYLFIVKGRQIYFTSLSMISFHKLFWNIKCDKSDTV